MYRKSCRRVWKLMAMLIGYILPISKQLKMAFEAYVVRSYETATDLKTKKNIKYAHNRLARAYPRGERKYCPFQEELRYVQVFVGQKRSRNTKVIQYGFI